MNSQDQSASLKFFKKKFWQHLAWFLIVLVIITAFLFRANVKKAITATEHTETIAIRASFEYLTQVSGIEKAQDFLEYVAREESNIEQLAFRFNTHQYSTDDPKWMTRNTPKLKDLPFQKGRLFIERGERFIITKMDQGFLWAKFKETKAIKDFTKSIIVFELIVVLVGVTAYFGVFFCFKLLFYPWLKKLLDAAENYSLNISKLKGVNVSVEKLNRGFFGPFNQFDYLLSEVLENIIWISSVYKQQPYGLLFATKGREVVYANEKMEELLGVTSENTIGDRWLDCLYPADKEKAESTWIRACNEQLQIQEQFRFRTPDGMINWVNMQVITLKGNNNRVIGFMGTFTPINRLKQKSDLLLSDT
ncbi:MAG: hypothetical protein SP1CHLAM54_00080 [Chlamydiia bacterium]|nr:hypothetical protein [Chlamydiia bacterium]MCH9614934.1 hypothetical protein [Chlamydiia bacterium]MCH9629881.1 hypothetical protein [Chlamydiia bacterium]